MILCVISNILLSKTLCVYFTLPYDCVSDISLYDTFDAITNLSFYCIFLYNFNHLHSLLKHKLYQKFILLLISLISNCTFSYISSIDELQSSIQLHDAKRINTYAYYIYMTIIIFQLCFTSYNIIKNQSKLTDISIRVIIILWFVIWIYFVYTNSETNIHVHHILFSLIVCIINYQNNLPTRIVFFTSLGVFIQGFINYKYEGLITEVIETEPRIMTFNRNIYKCEYDYLPEPPDINYICENFCF